VNAIRLLPLAALLLAGASMPAAAQARIECESRDYQYNFCRIPDGVDRARLVDQRSRAPCVEGRSWGWDARGIWVSNGCDGVFDFQPLRSIAAPPDRWPARADHLICESREYGYNFCRTGRIRTAQIVDQISQAPCIQGRTWGVDRDGIWVDNGCEAEFRVITR
jgi:hypothetical protein